MKIRMSLFLLFIVISVMIMFSCGQDGASGDVTDDATIQSSFIEGRYLKCSNGINMIVVDADGANSAFPCEMTPKDETVSFENLTDGDRIKIEIIAIAESYPAQTQVYAVEKLSDGEYDDIDADVRTSLYELGWIDDKSGDNDSLAEKDNNMSADMQSKITSYDVIETIAQTTDKTIAITSDETVPVIVPVDTIHDIADWEQLGLDLYILEHSPIYDLVSGCSEFSEYNELGITDYTITRLTPVDQDPLLRFEFTVTGESLPDTLPPGNYVKLIEVGYDYYIYDEPKPVTQEEYEAHNYQQKGLDIYGDIPEVRALAAYFDWTGGWNVADFGDYKLTENMIDVPAEYITCYYGDNDKKITYDDFKQLLHEKFGIDITPVEDEIKYEGFLHRCQYNTKTDKIEFISTLDNSLDYKIVNVERKNDTTNVTVQFYCDHNYLLPKHKVCYSIGDGDIFLGSELICDSPYLLPYMYR